MRYKDFIEHYFLIDEPKTGQLVPFKLRPVQIKYYEQLIKDYELCSTHCSRAMLAAQDGVLFFCQNCESSPNKFQVENAKAESPMLRTI